MAIKLNRIIQSAPKNSVIPKRKIKSAVKLASPTEEQDQIKLAVWLDKNKLPFYAIPNGGKRNFFEAVKLKRCGVKAGIPDICLPLPNRKGYHGLYIELKRVSGGRVSDEQLAWQELLRKNGYCAEIAYGLEEAKKIVSNYFEEETFLQGKNDEYRNSN